MQLRIAKSIRKVLLIDDASFRLLLDNTIVVLQILIIDYVIFLFVMTVCS